MVTEHEASLLSGVGMKIYENFEALVLLRLLDDGLFGSPDRRMFSLVRI